MNQAMCNPRRILTLDTSLSGIIFTIQLTLGTYLKSVDHVSDSYLATYYLAKQQSETPSCCFDKCQVPALRIAIHHLSRTNSNKDRGVWQALQDEDCNEPETRGAI